MSEIGKDLFLWLAGCVAGLFVIAAIEVGMAWPDDPTVTSGERNLAIIFAIAGGAGFLWWFA